MTATTTLKSGRHHIDVSRLPAHLKNRARSRKYKGNRPLEKEHKEPRVLPSLPYVVPAGALAPYLRRAIAKANKQYALENKTGGIVVIATRTNAILKRSGKGYKDDESICRKFSQILNGEQLCVSDFLADAILLADGILIEDTKIPVLCSTMKAARERVEIKAELKKKTLTEQEIHKLAEKELERTRRVIHNTKKKYQARVAMAYKEAIVPRPRNANGTYISDRELT